jgi:subtilisin family serine protease
LDLTHPDFIGRALVTQSFIEGQQVQDGHGHGTHCIGTACGPRNPSTGRRYGVAFKAEIYAGKVLSDEGKGSDEEILAGIEWAVTSNCHVISMSLGSDIWWPSAAYEKVGQRALQAGSLIVAAAGNNAMRPWWRGFVGIPANSKSIMAVAAIDRELGIATFSARSSGLRGGEVDIAGPGVDVYSSWPMPTRYRSISGTSMATPHVAGIAALMAEAFGYRADALWRSLTASARGLPLASHDVGAGLVQAPDRGDGA